MSTFSLHLQQLRIGVLLQYVFDYQLRASYVAFSVGEQQAVDVSLHKDERHCKTLHEAAKSC